MTSAIGRPSLSIYWPCRTLSMTCSRVCLRAMIREFPPVSILGHETHTNTGLLHGDPTNGVADYKQARPYVIEDSPI